MAIDIMAAFQSEPEALDFVLPGMIAGTVGAVVSPGGAGKTMFMLQAAMQLAGGDDTLGLDSLPGGRVWYLAAEDPESTIIHRLHALGGVTRPSKWERVARGLQIEVLSGHGPDLMRPEWQDFLLSIGSGSRLIVLDTLRRFHNLEENSSSDMARLLALLEHVARETGCSIVFAHHASKAAALGGMGDAQQASRGSSVLTDNVRWQSFLVGMSKGEAEELREQAGPPGPIRAGRGHYVRWGVSKSNYGPPVDERWYRRGPGGVLETVQLTEVKDGDKQRGRSDEV